METLLHEMIHAFLFVTDNNRDRDGHGPEFHKHMYRINAATGAAISVYHTFHDEVALYKQHWWRCSGPCTKKAPFYGFVKRAMNRAPGPADRWWEQHRAQCGGSFVKVKEPEKVVKGGKEKPETKGQKDIRDLLKGKVKGTGVKVKSNPGVGGKENSVPSQGRGKTAPGAMPKGLDDANEVRSRGSVGGGGAQGGGGGRGNIFGFGGTSFGGVGGGLKTRGKSGTVVVRPGGREPVDNSSGGRAVGGEVARGSSTSGGQRLGSTSAQVDGDLSVQEMLRRKWAAVGCGGSEQGATMGGSGRVVHTGEPGTSGVSGNGRVPKGGSGGSRRGAHTGGSWGDRAAQGGGGAVADQGSKQTAGGGPCCPVCSKSVAEEDMNSHLDSCLSATHDGHPPLPDPSDGFDDDDDAVLLAAAIDLENSLTESPTLHTSVVSISDSDDDEPLVKRRSDGGLSTEQDMFGDTTLQDDLDLLAALEGGEEQDTSMFACPVCDHLLSHGDMNRHLDTCVS